MFPQRSSETTKKLRRFNALNLEASRVDKYACHAGGISSFDSGLTIFKNEALFRTHSHSFGCKKKHVGSWFAAFDKSRGDNDIEEFTQARCGE